MEYRFPSILYAPYDGNGNFTVDQPAFSPSTTISSSAVNANNTDFASGLTNCLTKDGQSTPTAVIPLHVDGISYATDPDTGLHRTAANTQALRCGGTDVLTASTSDLTDASGASIRPFVGEIRMFGLPSTSTPSKWAICDGTALTATSPLRTALIAAGNPYGVSGSDPLLPDLRGRAPFGKDTTAARITVAGGNFNGNVLGGSQDRQSWTLTQAQLPAVAPTITVTNNPITPQPNARQQNAGLQGTGPATITAWVSNPYDGTALINAVNTNVGATSSNLGSGASHPIIAGALIVNFIIYVGA